MLKKNVQLAAYCVQMLADIRPNEEHAKEHIERNPVTTVAQVVPEMSEHEVRSRSASHDAEEQMLFCKCSDPTRPCKDCVLATVR